MLRSVGVSSGGRRQTRQTDAFRNQKVPANGNNELTLGIRFRSLATPYGTKGR